MLSSGNSCGFAKAAGQSVIKTALTAVNVGFGSDEEGTRISVSASLSLVMVFDGRMWPCVGGEPGKVQGRGVSQTGSSQKRTPSRLA
jgi:hypothetical protein